ncbi:hypothetical protein VTG60DRAFT_1851 [Thermothelomyces hinnuleus]
MMCRFGGEESYAPSTEYAGGCVCVCVCVCVYKHTPGTGLTPGKERFSNHSAPLERSSPSTPLTIFPRALITLTGASRRNCLVLRDLAHQECRMLNASRPEWIGLDLMFISSSQSMTCIIQAHPIGQLLGGHDGCLAMLTLLIPRLPCLVP